MNAAILLLLVCYAFLGLLLAALLIWSKWPAWAKTFAILAVAGFGILSYDGLTGLLGYPTPGKLPERFLYHFAVIVQPNRESGEKGAVWVWATALDKGGAAREPRAYELPFDKETYNIFTEAQKRAKAGIVQMGSTSEAPAKEGTNMMTRYMGTGAQQKVKMQDLPEPALPEK